MPHCYITKVHPPNSQISRLPPWVELQLCQWWGAKGARHLTRRSICWELRTNRHLNIMKGVVSLAKRSLWLCHSNLFQLMEFQPFPIITIPYYGNLICIINSSSHMGVLPSFHSLSAPVPFKFYLVVRK